MAIKSSAWNGVALAMLACACGAPEAEGGANGATYVPAAPSSQAAASSATASKPPAATPSLQPTATANAPSATSSSAAAVPPPAAAVPPPASAPAVTPPPAMLPAMAAAAGAPATPPSMTTPIQPPSGFNAGAGMIQPDGKTVVFHIADGTGGNNWDKKENPIRVRRGMVLHLVDDDKSTRAGGHWLHTNGQPCPHGLKAIGAGFDCNISQNAPMGIISGVFEHNVANGIGQLFIEVVAE